jgi:ABC-type multidrug transport system ATPase subunit
VDVDKTLSTYNLIEYKHCFPNELSLGTSQRLNVAIRMMNSTPNIIADEPFNGLDPIESKNLQDVFMGLKSNKGTMIISSHDILSLVSLCDKLIYLKEGKLVEVDKENIGEINEIHKLLQ